MSEESKYKITISDETSDKIGAAIARRLFESRGNNSEIHLKEVELALIISVSVKQCFAKADISEIQSGGTQ